MQLTKTIDLVEVIWTVFTLVGLYYNTRLLFRASTDLVVVKIKQINSVREFSAMTTVVLFSALSIVQFMFVLIGGFEMTLPDRGPHTMSDYVVAVAFITISFVLALMGGVVEKRREALLAKIIEIEGGME